MTETELRNTPSLLSSSEPTLSTVCEPLKKIYDTHSLDELDELNERIVRPLVENEEVVTVDMTRKINVRMKEEGKGYRARIVDAGDEYFVTDLILTLSERLIVRLAPADDREWDAVELGVTQADVLFPELGAALLKAHGIKEEAENLVTCILLVVENFNIQDDRKAALEQMKNNPLFGLI